MNSPIVKTIESPRVMELARNDASVSDWFKLLRRRRKIVIYTLVAFLALVTLKAVITTPKYQAVGELQVQKESSSALGPLEGGQDSSDGAGNSADALDYNITLQTQVGILESDTLAMGVIKDLHLESTEDFFPQKKSIITIPAQAFFWKKSPQPLTFSLAIPSWVFFWKKPLEPLSVPLDQAPNRRYVTLKIFSKNLKIEPVSGSRLIDISYKNPDPKLAADVVNHMINSFMEYSFQTRLTATSQSTAWLGQQLGDLKNQTQELEAKAIQLQRETGMFGDGDEHNMVLARLKDLNEAYTTAESNRIIKGAVYRAVLNGGADSVSGLGGTAILGGNTSSPDNSLALLQTLRAQETQIRAQVAEDKTRYGASYPKLIQAEAQLADTQNAIREETQRITARAQSDYEIAAKSETDAQTAFEKQKEIANQLNDKVIAYDMAKEEADKSRELYEGLLGKLKQADVLEGLRSSNVSIVNPARVPSSNKPKSPNLPLYYAAGLAGGLFFGIGAAIIVDFRDKTYRTTDEVENDLGSTLFGEMPAFDRKDATTGVLIGSQGRRLLDSGFSVRGRRVPVEKSIYSLEYPGSAFAESVRSLRTVLSLSRNVPPSVVLVTSSTSDEGKTTLSLNLAAAYAKQGGRVLLVNGDLRKRGLDKRLGPTNYAGLSELLSHNAEPDYCTYKDETNLTILFGGEVPPFPAELLGSERMRELVAKWRREYDFVIIDSPPVLPVTDAILLSQIADASLLIVRHGVTPRETVQRSYRLLRQQLPSQSVLGLVMNAIPEGATRYYAYYGSEESHLKVERVRNNAS